MSPFRRLWLTLVAVALVAALVGALMLTRQSARPSDTGSEGSAGLGDPYLPEDGGGGYDVQNYRVDLSWDARERTLSGTTAVRLRTTQALDSLHLDLKLAARSASVGGTALAFQQEGDDLRIQFPRSDPDRVALPSGSEVELLIGYSGAPGDVPDSRSEPAFYREGEEILIAGEPHAATWWFPANDAPRDPATYTFTLHVPNGVEALGPGRLIARGVDPADDSWDTWEWRVDQPTVTYATFLAIGQYEVSAGTTDGRPYVYAVSELLPERERRAAMDWLRKTPSGIAKLERYFGPYPVDVMGGIVPGVQFFWGGLECIGRPVYNAGLVGSQLLLQHELAHMWAGDRVTLAEWNDVYLNEALASYGEWLTDSESTPERNFRRVYGIDQPAFWGPALSDPGRKAMFERVYDRGPASLHALRTRVGDAVFFAFIKDWMAQSGPRTLEQFRQAADDATPEDLTGFFVAWLDQTTRPERTRENGIS